MHIHSPPHLTAEITYDPAAPVFPLDQYDMESSITVIHGAVQRVSIAVPQLFQLAEDHYIAPINLYEQDRRDTDFGC